MKPHLQLVTDDPLARTGDVPQQLRKIADEIESGITVGVTSAVVIVRSAGGQIDVHGIRDGDEMARLHAAYMLLSLALRDLERVAVAAET